jgi:predicted permease
MTFDIDWRVLAFALTASAVSGVVFGLAPALDLGRRQAADALRSGATAADSRSRMQRVFVIAEVALSITLVVGAALSLESVARMRRIPLGIDAAGVVVFRATLQGPRYDSAQARARFVAEVERRLAALPGVSAAGAADSPPIIGCCSQFRANIEGYASASGHLPMITGTIVTPGYFDALGIRRVAGRTFTASDDEHAPPVTVIDETFAAQYFPNGDAIGHHVNGAMIVGVVNDIKQNGLLDGPTPQFFLPWAEKPWTRVTFMLRTSADSAATVAAARRVLHDVDPTAPMFEATTMSAILDRATVSSRNFRNLLLAFAAIALLLAAAGLYGLAAFVVERRRRELGLRIALGAEPRAVRALVIRQAAALAGIGTVLGLAGSIAASRWLSSTLYGVHGMSWDVYVAAAGLLAVTAVAAAYGPARRASRVDPLIALRSD